MNLDRRYLYTAVIGATLLACVAACNKTPKEAPKPVFKVPETVLMYAGTDDPSKLLTGVHTMAKEVIPSTPDPNMMVGPLLQGEFRLLSPAEFDFKRPLRFVLFAQKKYGRDPSATVIGIKDAKTFEKVIPGIDKRAGAAEGEGKKATAKNAWVYKKTKNAKYPVYVNFLTDHVVLTRHPDLFSENQEFLRLLVKEPFKGGGGAVVKMDHVLKYYDQKTVSKVVKQQTAGLPMASSTDPNAPDKVVESVMAFAAEVTELHAQLDASVNGLKTTLTWVPKANTPLAKLTKTLESAPHTLLKRSPRDSAFVSSLAIKKAAMQSLVKEHGPRLEALVAGVAGGLGESALTALRLIDGRNVVMIHPSASSDGLAFSTLTGVTDVAAHRANAKKANAAATGALAGAGIGTNSQEDAYKIGDHSVTVQKLTAAGPQGMILSTLGLTEDHSAYDGSVRVQASGPDAKGSLEKHLTRAFAGLDQSPPMVDAFKNGTPNAFFMFFVSPIQLVQKAKLGGMNPFAVSLAGIQSQSGLSFSAGKSEDRIVMTLFVPTGLLKDGMAAFQKVNSSF